MYYIQLYPYIIWHCSTTFALEFEKYSAIVWIFLGMFFDNLRINWIFHLFVIRLKTKNNLDVENEVDPLFHISFKVLF